MRAVFYNQYLMTLLKGSAAWYKCLRSDFLNASITKLHYINIWLLWNGRLTTTKVGERKAICKV